jgi:tetratricopeptide (TPR) repeat protein
MRGLTSRRAWQAVLLAGATLALGLPPPAVADVVHLKNGGWIDCDRVEERGDDLVVHQRQGTIVVPRREVARIDKTPAPAGGSTPGAPAVSAGPAASTEGGARSAAFDRAGALRRLETLKSRLEQFPLAREQNREEIVVLLNRLGEDDLNSRRPEEARRRFEEALAYDGAGSRATRGLAAAHLALGQDAYARSVLERGLLEAPGDPGLLLLLGLVAERQDRQEEALATWEKALAARPDPALRERIEALRRRIGVEEGYLRAEAAHFTLRYDGERTGPDLEAAILSELEERFRDLVRRFDHLPAQPIAVVVYPQRAFYEATLAESDVAGLYDGKIRLPAGGLRGLDGEARAVLLHELAHAFITDKSGGRAPRWLQEGLAQWIEGRRTTTATSRDLAREWQRCCAASGWGSTFTYASALSFVEFLLDRAGSYGVNLILSAMGRGLGAEEAIREVTRSDLQDLTREWGEELARRHLQ